MDSRRDLVQTTELRAGEHEAEPLSQQAVEGAEAKRPEDQSAEAVLRKRAVEPERHAVSVRVRPLGKEEDDSLLPEAAKRELEYESRRAVEPLDVVDGDYERAGLCQDPHPAEEGDGHGALVRRPPFRVFEQQGDLERSALGRRQRRERVGERRLEQVREGCEGEPRLRGAGRRAENPVAELEAPPRDRLSRGSSSRCPALPPRGRRQGARRVRRGRLRARRARAPGR